MAFQFPYIFKGISMPQAYAKVVQGNLDFLNSGGHIVFNIYQNQASREANPIGNVIAQKSYSPTADEYATFLSATALDPLNNNAQTQSYAYALAKLDCASAGVDSPPAQGITGVSFFSAASSV